MANKSISQLTTTIAVDNGTLLEIASPDQNSASGYASEKMSVAQLADHVGTSVSFPTLSTTSKNLVGAINEAAQTGGGGTTVVANPSGTPTDTLNTVQIGQTIYDIEGSGGSGLVYQETTITSLTNGTIDTSRGGCWYARWGNVMHLHLSVKDLTVETSTNVYTIPSSLRPPHITAMGIGIGEDRTKFASVSIGAASGACNLWSQSTTALIDVEWLIEDSSATGGSGAVNYSTTEHVVGTWIDGTPLYEKTVSITGNGEYQHGITNINLIADCIARVIRNDGACIPIPTYNNTSYYGYVVATKTIINLYVAGSNWQPSASNPCYVTVRYTKTA